MKKLLNCLFVIILLLPCSGYSQRRVFEENFKNPPVSTKPSVYWYWINEHVTKEGITKDLEAMKRVGIGEAFIGNVYEEGRTPGALETLSEQWKECMQFAISEASRIGVNVSIFNGPGWSQSGGPWVTPEDAMRYLTYSIVTLDAGDDLSVLIPKPDKDFTDVAVLAYPMKTDEVVYSNITSLHKASNLNYLLDNNPKTKVTFPNKANELVVIDIDLAHRETVRGLMIKPLGQGFNTDCELQVKRNGQYETIKKLFFDRAYYSRQLGPTPDGTLVMTFPGVEGDAFRICLSNLPANFELEEVSLSTSAKIEKVTEKLLYKLPSTSNPAWNAHHWDSRAISNQENFPNSKEVLNISSYLHGDTLKWRAPKGKWKIMRVGTQPTNTTNTPAAPKAVGLEVDKMSSEVLQKHFDAHVGDIIKGMDKKDLKSLKRLIVDSYEVGPQNWTPNLQADFISKMGYDPLPWFPVLNGDIIGSEEESNRFLWDMRRTIADLISEKYVGGLRDIAHKNGMTLWLENYGHWGYPSEFLYYGSFSDNVGGEFWSGSGPTAECKLASSSCHIYGKNVVYSESYTAGGDHYRWSPDKLKQKGDWSYTQGINQVVLHVYIHQPYDDKVPGVNSWFGIEFNRHNTWFEQSKAWIDYQRRCSYMLQQGVPVNDLCIYIGEDAPIMNGWVPEGIEGYKYDFINADVIKNRLSVKNGRFILPNGIEYAALVLPPVNTMRPEVLIRIKALVEAGGVVIGLPPTKSPSKVDYPNCDTQIQELSKSLWGKTNLNADEKISRNYGKGWIYANVEMAGILNKHKCVKDLTAKSSDIQFEHRKLSQGDIYFLTNQGQETINDLVEFRVTGKRPELWDAVQGTMRPLSSYRQTGNGTIIPLTLKNGESCFIVFIDSAESNKNSVVTVAMQYPLADTLMMLNDKWDIQFSNKKLNQDYIIKQTSLFDWSQHKDDDIKYFSGTAVYSNTFVIDKSKMSENIKLAFDYIYDMGTIFLNGKEVSTLWTYPYQTDITPYLQDGENKLEVHVTNQWNNQMVYQSKKPVSERSAWVLLEVFTPDKSLTHSGIVGNASIISIK